MEEKQQQHRPDRIREQKRQIAAASGLYDRHLISLGEDPEKLRTSFFNVPDYSQYCPLYSQEMYSPLGEIKLWVTDNDMSSSDFGTQIDVTEEKQNQIRELILSIIHRTDPGITYDQTSAASINNNHDLKSWCCSNDVRYIVFYPHGQEIRCFLIKFDYIDEEFGAGEYLDPKEVHQDVSVTDAVLLSRRLAFDLGNTFGYPTLLQSIPGE